MITVEEAREAVRPSLSGLVDHHVEQGTARMQAYGRVASLIGRSSAWVQRIIGRDPEAVVGLHDALNIRAAYERLCARVEADNARLDAELLTIRGDHDAAAAPAPRKPAPPRRSGRGEDLRFCRRSRTPALIAA